MSTIRHSLEVESMICLLLLRLQRHPLPVEYTVFNYSFFSLERNLNDTEMNALKMNSPQIQSKWTCLDQLDLYLVVDLHLLDKVR